MAPATFIPISNTVCVMDASGCLGAALVNRLLHKGYIVHAAFPLQQNGEVQEFKGLSKEERERLKIFRSDLFDYQSILEALKGCSGLFYNFELPHDQPIYDEHSAEIEVRAAHNVLEACAQTDTIDKVVFTSSASAVIWTEDRKSLPSDLDERHWSDDDFCRKFKLWHALSKTLAEKTAWALAMDRGISMVTINAGLLVGPNLSIRHPYLKGAAEMYQDGVLVTVDLTFLVDAHIYVFEDISSYGRYLCFNHVINRPEDAIKLAKILLPSASVHPQSFMLYQAQNATHYVSNSGTTENSSVLEKPQYTAGGSSTLLPVSPPGQFTSANWRVNSGVVQGRKKRRRRPPKVCRNKEEAETQRLTLIAEERNCRKLMNDHLTVLRSLMPESYAQRGDQASIVCGAIEVLKELEHIVQSLELQKLILPHRAENLRSRPGATLVTILNSKDLAEFLSDPDQCPSSDIGGKYTLRSKAEAAEIEVTLIETHANLRILSKKSARQLSKMVSGFQTLGLTILHLNVTSFKVGEGCQLNCVESIAKAVHQMLRIIEDALSLSLLSQCLNIKQSE